MREIFIVVYAVLVFDGCAFKSLQDSVEGIYSDEVVVKPSKANYKTAPANSTKPILQDATPISKTPQEIAKAQSERFDKKGYIQNVSYDPDIKLYIYRFKTVPDGESLVFFYDKKLSYKDNDLFEVDIKDNFLMNVKHQKASSSYKEVSLSKRIKKHRKREKNFKLHEAIEEKINTL